MGGEVGEKGIMETENAELEGERSLIMYSRHRAEMGELELKINEIMIDKLNHQHYNCRN